MYNQNFINSVFNSSIDESTDNWNLSDSYFDNIPDAEYLDIYSDIDVYGDEYFNLFGSRKRKGKRQVGGKKWNKREARRFAKKAPGKVETARTKLNAIISVTPEEVKKSNKAEKFAKMQTKSKVNLTELEAQWAAFQKAQSIGWDNQDNREVARKAYNKIIQINATAIHDWKLRHNYITDRKIDKVSQVLKTTNPALIAMRTMYLLFIRGNFFNLASIYKLASIRKNSEYNIL